MPWMKFKKREANTSTIYEDLHETVDYYKAGELFIKRCTIISSEVKMETKKRKKRANSKQNGSPLYKETKPIDVLEALPLESIHINFENICSNTYENCECASILKEILRYRRYAIYEEDLQERKGLKVYIKSYMKKKFINRYYAP